MNECLLAGGMLYDGTGSAPYAADLLIRDGKIVRIEPAGKNVFPCVPRRTLTGLSVSPGWIDVHAHSDASLLAAPEAFGKISQGITTEVSGNCGLSAFPVMTGEVREHLAVVYAAYDVRPDWDDFDSYAAALEKRHPAVNALFLCGHNTLRANITGYSRHDPAPGELAAMRELLAEQLRQGAAGMSTGLLYTPGRFAGEPELLELLRTVSAAGGIYTTHLRSEGDRLEEAAGEALRLAERSGAHLLISHLKTALPRNWHKLDRVLGQIEAARKRGLAVHADRYPYTYSQTSLSIVLDAPFDAMTDRAIRDALQNDPILYAQALKQLTESGRDWTKVILSKTDAPGMAGLAGLTVCEAADRQRTTPAELVMEILRADAPGSLAAFGGMSEENLGRILAREWVCCGTDETARPEDESLGRSHPRGFGSFPRFILRLKQLGIPMAEIIRRITSLPAGIFGLQDRGSVRPGMAADLVIFAEDELDSRADFRHPHCRASGIRQVMVNGVAAYDGENGKVLARPGKVLRK